MIWASPAASFRSVLLGRTFKAALAWRASMQMTGRPRSCNSFQSQPPGGRSPSRCDQDWECIGLGTKKAPPGRLVSFSRQQCGRHHRRYKWPWLPAIHRVRQRSTWSFPFDCGVRPATTRPIWGITALKRGGPRDYAKWSTLSYGFARKEDQNAEEELQAGRDRRQAAAG
jgi:hypothetical protein